MDALETASLLYREPDLYAAMTDGGAAGAAKVILALADRFGPTDARAVLDIGCGTGAVLEQLAHRYPTAVGVDLLAGMVEIANKRRTDVDVHVGDMRTIRLGQRFDLVVCVGNALSYLTEQDYIAAAFLTFAEHCLPGGLLVLQTVTACPPLDKAKTSSVAVSGRHANVSVTYSREASEETLTMTRHWTFDDGQHATDLIRRRVLSPEKQEVFAAAAGFRPASHNSDSDTPRGTTAFVRHALN